MEKRSTDLDGLELIKKENKMICNFEKKIHSPYKLVQDS